MSLNDFERQKHICNHGLAKSNSILGQRSAHVSPTDLLISIYIDIKIRAIVVRTFSADGVA